MLLSMDRAGYGRPRDGVAWNGDALDRFGWIVLDGWGVQDSNLRRQCHLIYSQAPLTARETPLASWFGCAVDAKTGRLWSVSSRPPRSGLCGKTGRFGL